MHHVELLLDPTAEAAVRSEWERLAVAGLPSLADHRHPSNRPHLTLTVASRWPPGAVDGPVSTLPLSVELGPLICFGSRPWVLARLVVPTEGLLALQRAVVTALGPPTSVFCEVGRWVPHVSLAHRLSATQLVAALELLSPAPVMAAVLDRARHWDSGLRIEEPVPLTVGHDDVVPSQQRPPGKNS